ncbi:MAG: ABC transporter substrate-binding protein, partial [Candidatus Limnocylindria bacterium]
ARSATNGLAVAVALAVVLAACGGGEASPAASVTASGTPSAGSPTPAAPDDPLAFSCDPVDYQGEPATLSFPWWVGGGDSPSDALFTDALECFKTKYAGSIEVEVEYVPSGEDYQEKMRTDFAASGKVPVVFALKRVGPDLQQILLEQNALVDLMPYFEASPEWQEISISESTALNTVDGKLVAAPDTFVTPVGLFYNTELMAEAGVEAIPETWDEWFAALDKFKAAGIPAVALHTGDTGWSAMLLYEALMARDPAGVDFLTQKFPSDFNQPFIVDANTDIARIFQFTTDDAVGAAYDMAANNFLSGKAAIMPNGPWMIGQFRDPAQSSEGFGDKIASGLYPGNVAIDDAGLQLGDFAVGAGYSQAETDAAAEFAKWMSSAEFARQRVIRIGSIAPNLELPPEDLASLDPLASDLIQLIQDNGAPVLPNYQGQWNSIIQNETIVQGLPQLALGNLTAEQFAQQLTDAAQQNP